MTTNCICKVRWWIGKPPPHARHCPAADRDDDVRALEAYLLVCVRNRDWHGVSDAANDLRVLEARRGR